MDIFTLTIVITLVLFVVIGNYAGKNVKSLDDYFVAGRRAPTFLIVGTLVASVMSSVAFSVRRASPMTVNWVPICCSPVRLRPDML